MKQEGVTILIPIYNDWEALSRLLPELDRHVPRDGPAAPIHVLLIDDGSTQPRALRLDGGFQNIRRLEVLRLRRNLGHQRALAIGLAFAEANRDCSAVVVMDGDGEDRPEDVPRLLEHTLACGGECIVFAQRAKRSEVAAFRVGYHAYRWLHLVLTGIPVRMGNFSVIPRGCLNSLAVVSEVWNHYTAAVIKARLPYRTLSTTRGKRLSGRSSMNLVSLITHGLSAISVFRERVGVRLLLATGTFAAVTLALIAATVIVRFTTDLAVPGWATYTVGLLLVLLSQAFFLLLLATFAVLGGRDAAGFLPARDYAHFVRDCEVLYSRP